MKVFDGTYAALFKALSYADKAKDGHLTIMKFTTGWKVFLGTPEIDNDQRFYIDKEIEGGTLLEALEEMLDKKLDIGKAEESSWDRYINDLMED
jgi:hypothetical protein